MGSSESCLPKSEPTLGTLYSDAHDAGAKVLGVEYELYGAGHGNTNAFFHTNLHEEGAPCRECVPLL